MSEFKVGMKVVTKTGDDGLWIVVFVPGNRTGDMVIARFDDQGERSSWTVSQCEVNPV